MCTEDGHYFKEATITENDLFLVYKITPPIFQKIKILHRSWQQKIDWRKKNCNLRLIFSELNN